MKNEPVAWMSQGGDVTRSRDYFVEMGFTDLIPLYTHPVQKPMMVLDGNRVYPVVKELTDEVMEQVRVAIMGAAYWCADENMPEAYNAIKVCCGQVLGILDKAQEK